MELSLVYQWVNFSIFLGLLFYFLKDAIRDFLGDRRESLKKELDEVQKERLRFEGRLQEYRKKLATSDAEIKQLREELKQEGEIEKAKLIKKSHEFAQKIREDGVKVGEQELSKAKLTLQKNTVLFSAKVAQDLLEQIVDSKDQERLFALGIQQLDKVSYERKSIS